MITIRSSKRNRVSKLSIRINTINIYKYKKS